MQTLVDNATSTFESTTGLTFSDVISWMTVQLKLIMGTGLAILQDLMPWIVGLIALGAIVYFAFRAFRFYRH